MGLQLASPSMARATTNLAPGITFAIAAVIGYSSPSPPHVMGHVSLSIAAADLVRARWPSDF